MKKIILLVDFTGVCQLAMEHTAILARQSLSQVVLLHIAAVGRENEEKAIKHEIREFAKILERKGWTLKRINGSIKKGKPLIKSSAICLYKKKL